ncbi:MAG: hypothetical protein HY749_22835 [Gammaproteobacteria bacterium]|nr:hypothetical protein [Gammaproteobacteria bacterium]MBI5617193.1 hypothetical protein [Gammaproteobacteria bacterium]
MKKSSLILAAIIAAGSLLPLAGQAAEDATGAAPTMDTAPAPVKKTTKHKKHKSTHKTTHKTTKKAATQ